MELPEDFPDLPLPDDAKAPGVVRVGAGEAQAEGFTIIASSGGSEVAVFAGADTGEDGNAFTVGSTRNE